MSFQERLAQVAADVNKVLGEMLAPARADWDGAPANVGRYAALDAGKRLRAFLCVETAALFGVDTRSALRAGACIEMVHNFSLIHDDLPCIDNDKIRRGRPSAWAKFGECDAILGGDYLLNHAYMTLVSDTKISKDVNIRMKLMHILSEMTNGMLLGEWMDTAAEKGKFQTAPEVNAIQSLKTGCMFNACTLFGATLGGVSAAEYTALQQFTDAMGLCFQITDDILDVVGNPDKVGKTLNKDDAAGKATYISLYGLERAREYAAKYAADAKRALDIFGPRANTLKEMMDYMITRES
ncbi:MAG: polyprenyl synthetase family protein [Rickettsiales bacterium]|jgi:farnesyl diphosphate synthase|nr:polyprenyl synthetase family protein [Rickettsiales bacterium]